MFLIKYNERKLDESLTLMHTLDQQQQPPPVPPPQQQNPPDGQPPQKRPKFRDEASLPVHLVPRITGPRVVLTQLFRTVNFDELDDFFNSSYTQYVTLLFPDQPAPPAHLITQVQWTGILKAMLKARVDHVYGRSTGQRPANRLPLSGAIPVPKLIADVINSYGYILVHHGSTIVIPVAQAAPQGVNPPGFVVADEILFSSFVSSLSHRGFASLSTISNDHIGSAAYTLFCSSVSLGRHAAANPVAANIATQNTLSVFVSSWHNEFTPSDVLLASLMTNGYSNNLLASTQWPFYSDVVNDVPGIRTSLFSHY